MDTNKYLCWCSCLIAIEIGFMDILQLIHIDSKIESTPVEEMYHRQLVITLDSILDARFNTGCCEEVIDSDSINVAQDTNGNILLPFNH